MTKTRGLIIGSTALAAFLVGGALLFVSSPSPAQTPPPSTPEVVSIYDVSFVEIAGRPEHQVYIPMQAGPIRGMSATVRVTVFGPVETAAVDLLNDTREILVTIPIARLSQGDPRSPEFYGTVVVPLEPFQVAVRGTDTSGAEFSLGAISAEPIQPQTVQFKLISSVAPLAGGTPARFLATLTNFGDPDTFAIVASDTPVTSLQLSSTSVTLGTQQSAFIEISTITPNPSDELSSYALQVQATRASTGLSSTATLAGDIDSKPGQTLAVRAKPGFCDEAIKLRGRGTVSVAIMATPEFDPTRIDANTIYLLGVIPSRVVSKDVGSIDTEACRHRESEGKEIERKDGRHDVVLFFDNDELAASVALLTGNPNPRRHKETFSIPLTARIAGEGTRCVGFVPVRY